MQLSQTVIKSFTEIIELIFKFIQKLDGDKISKANFKKNDVRRDTPGDFGTCYKVVTFETMTTETGQGEKALFNNCVGPSEQYGENLTVAPFLEPYKHEFKMSQL